MYFNEKNTNTNIDNEFTKNNILQTILQILNKYKIFIIVAIVIILLIIMISLFINKKVSYYLDLNGEETITLYQGTDYIEPGYKAYNSKKEDLTSEVDIKSTLNINQIGEYQITYTLGEITKTRKINIVEKQKEYTYIYLKTRDNNVNIYLKVGEKYNEPGYQVFNSAGKDLNDKVIITGNIDTSKKGSYKLTYSVVDSANVTITATRTIVVMDTDINLSLSPSSYTNGKVTINIGIIDDYFDYLILPDGRKVNNLTYSYSVNSNGKYTFTVYNKKGTSKTESIEVKNIDKTAPTGKCTIDQFENGSIINISASDSSGIQKYVYNNQSYTSSEIKLSTTINSAQISIYDKANNKKDINCTATPKVYINNISKDGVIVTINAKKINNNITGYYFSYTNKRPSKTSGGYISTNKESIDVVRLPGTTYVWVEDSSGKISSAKTITITNDALFTTVGNEYKILEGTNLSTYLSNKGWSITGLNNLIARSVRAAGLHTKEAAATSAVAMQTVLAQKYQIKIPYWWGGKSWSHGADSNWGQYRVTAADSTTYYYYGLDCSGYTTWAYVNAGYKVGYNEYPQYWWGYKMLKFSKDNGEIGDFLINNDHIKIIVGKTPTAFITAEAKGKNYGIVISTHSYSSPNGYKIEKGEDLMNAYSKISSSSYPSGF